MQETKTDADKSTEKEDTCEAMQKQTVSDGCGPSKDCSGVARNTETSRDTESRNFPTLVQNSDGDQTFKKPNEIVICELGVKSTNIAYSDPAWTARHIE